MIIGIGGVSRAGKTTLAFKIREWFGKAHVCILHQDQYIQDESNMPLIKNHIDWEHPDSLDFEMFKKITNEKAKEYSIVIVEGLMVFHDDELNEMMDRKIYIKISKEAFLSRKTMDNRWGKEPEWYIDHIWQSHFIYGLIPKNEKNVLEVDGEACGIDEIVQNYLKNT